MILRNQQMYIPFCELKLIVNLLETIKWLNEGTDVWKFPSSFLPYKMAAFMGIFNTTSTLINRCTVSCDLENGHLHKVLLSIL